MNGVGFQPKVYNTLLSLRDELHPQVLPSLRLIINGYYSRENMKNDSTKNFKADHKVEHKFGECLYYGKFHLCNSCVFLNNKCFKYSEIRHIQLVVRLPFILPHIIPHFVIQILLTGVFLMISWPYPRFQKIMSMFGSNYIHLLVHFMPLLLRQAVMSLLFHSGV